MTGPSVEQYDLIVIGQCRFCPGDVSRIRLMIIFLVVAILGLALGMRHHGSPWALTVGIQSAVTLYVFIYVSFNEVIAGLGIDDRRIYR